MSELTNNTLVGRSCTEESESVQSPDPLLPGDQTEDSSGIRGKRFRPGEMIIEWCIRVVAFCSLVFIILIFLFVFREASSLFVKSSTHHENSIGEAESYGDEALGTADEMIMANLDNAFREADESNNSFLNLLGSVWQPISLEPKYGIWPLFLGSVKVALITLLIAGPIAILAALYTSTFAPQRIKELIKPIIEILAGFPSVVIGFFALTIMATLFQNLFGYQYRLNAFIGGLSLSIAIIPVIFTISEDALNAIPRSFIEASYALGAEKWETALFVALPAAMPGIFAALLLGTGRAIGETMIVLMATGNAAFSSLNPFHPVRTMSATIGAEMAEVVFGDFHYGVLFFIGVILFLISFVINLIAETYVRQLVMRRFK